MVTVKLNWITYAICMILHRVYTVINMNEIFKDTSESKVKMLTGYKEHLFLLGGFLMLSILWSSITEDDMLC